MKEDRRHIIITFVLKILIAFASMGVVIVTSRELGAEGRGVISYILLLISLAQLASEFIGGSSLINLAPMEKMINLILPSYLANILVSIGLTLVFMWVSTYGIQTLSIFLTCLLLGFVNINLSIILGRSFINTRNGIQLGYMILTLAGVYVTYKVNDSSAVQDYFNILIFSYAIGLLTTFFFLFKVAQHGDFKNFTWNRKLYQWGFWSQCSQVINLLNYRLMYFFIERDYSIDRLGVFGNAMTVGDMLKISGHSLGQVQHNRIINSKHLTLKAQEILPSYLGMNVLLYLIQGIVLLVIPAIFWEYLLGVEFSMLKEEIVYLLPGFLCMGVATTFSFHFHALARFKINLVINALTLLTFILSYTILVDAYDYMAIHLSFSIAFAIQLILFVVSYIAELKYRKA